MDKIRLLSEIPYDETIFIDADCLAYSDLNVLFSVFSDADDFSCFGNIASNPEESAGWFNWKNLPNNIQNRVEYTVGLHGGVYFMRKTEKLMSVFASAEHILSDYASYKFNGFVNPADEPVLALSMAINKCKPIPFSTYGMVCYWNTDIYLSDEPPMIKRSRKPISLLHWGTRYTKTPYYRYEVEKNEFIDRNCLQKTLFKLKYQCSVVKYKLYIISLNSIEKASKVNFLKKIWHLLKKIVYLSKNQF